MDIFNNLWLGFSIAGEPMNILYCFIGALLGTIIGVLPGLGPVATMAILLPITYYIPPAGALIMLSGIYYGSQYGGSTTSILMNMPGEAASVVTCLDGHQMARKGRGGAALAISAMGSFFAGTVATVLIALFSAPLAHVATQFKSADYFSLMVFGLIAAVVLSNGSIIKAIPMLLLGLLMGLVGTDINSGEMRYTFGLESLADGLDFVPVAMGLFGVAEIISNLEARAKQSTISRVGSLWPSGEEIRRSIPAAIRGTGIGSLLGILPGGGALLASFASYAVEKKISKTPERFGEGAVEGVAGPESANNAGAQTCFIPLLTLGIPPNAIMALMVGAMMIQGIAPGPLVMTQHPDLFWGIIASMWIGNIILLIINLPLIGVWVRLLQMPYKRLYPAILVFCAIGVYTLNNSTMDLYITAFFGLLGYFFRKAGCEPAPLLLGFVLGPMMEDNLRRTLLISGGSPMPFFDRPISLAFLIASLLVLLILALPKIRRTRVDAFRE